MATTLERLSSAITEVSRGRVTGDMIVPRAYFDEKIRYKSGVEAPTLGFDSMGMVELVLALEETFQIKVSDDDATQIRTVQDALDYLASMGVA